MRSYLEELRLSLGLGLPVSAFAPSPPIWGVLNLTVPQNGGYRGRVQDGLDSCKRSTLLGQDFPRHFGFAIALHLPDIVDAHNIAIGININVAAGSLIVDVFACFEER